MSSVFTGYILYVNTPMIYETTRIYWYNNSLTWAVKEIYPSIVQIFQIKSNRDVHANILWMNNSYKEISWVWAWFFITEKWHILTSKHVTDANVWEYIIKTNDWLQYGAKIIYIDSKKDLAVLQAFDIKNTQTPIHSKPVHIIETITWSQLWEYIFTIGHPFDTFINSLSFWIIAWYHRTIQVPNKKGDVESFTDLIQTDIAMHWGNSWGPLVNLHGIVLWINTATENIYNMGFSTPITQQEIFEILKKIED